MLKKSEVTGMMVFDKNKFEEKAAELKKELREFDKLLEQYQSKQQGSEQK